MPSSPIRRIAICTGGGDAPGLRVMGVPKTTFGFDSAVGFETECLDRLDSTAQSHQCVMVALTFPNVNYVPLVDVAGRMKAVPLDGDTLQTARDVGICLGD
jgi:hypothetical protein